MSKDYELEARIRHQVEKRMEERREYYAHITAFVMVNLMLWAIWAVTDFGGHPWPIYPMLGWGIGIAIHTVNFYNVHGGGRLSEQTQQAEIEWKADEDAMRRRIGELLSQRHEFFIHLLLYIFVVSLISLYVQSNVVESFRNLYNDPDVIQSFQELSAGVNFLLPLEQIQLGLLFALLWGSLLFDHLLSVIYNSGGRLERKRNVLQHELELIYGPHWRDVASVADYKRTRKGVERRFARSCRLIGHIVTVVFLTLIAVHFWTPIKESLAIIQISTPEVADLIAVNFPVIVFLIGMITVLLHGLGIGIGSLFGDDALERAMQHELKRERERSGLYSSP
jgi:fatty acid desaturase